MADEIMRELWAIKDEIARKANYDVRTLCRQLREQQGKSGAVMVDRSAKPAAPGVRQTLAQRNPGRRAVKRSTRDRRVIELAKRAHAQWKRTGNQPDGNRLAAVVTKKWQKDVQRQFPGAFEAEFKVAKHLKQKIDLVDTARGVAYEFKVSENNTHFEYYRDVFKALAAKRHTMPNLKKLIFITPAKPAETMRQGLGEEANTIAAELGIVCEIEDI